MPKNQAAGADKWRKKIKKYLDDPAAAALSRHSVDSAAIALPLLRAALAGNAPLIAAFPELNLAERAVAELEEFRQELDLPLRLLVIPEAGRGKLLFPGGESRRARALNAALTGEFDLVVGSVHALLAPAPAPETTVEAQLTLKAGMELPMAELLESWSGSTMTTNMKRRYRGSSRGAAASSTSSAPPMISRAAWSFSATPSIHCAVSLLKPSGPPGRSKSTG